MYIFDLIEAFLLLSWLKVRYIKNFSTLQNFCTELTTSASRPFMYYILIMWASIVIYFVLQNFLFTSKDEDSELKAIDFGLSEFVKPGLWVLQCVYVYTVV